MTVGEDNTYQFMFKTAQFYERPIIFPLMFQEKYQLLSHYR